MANYNIEFPTYIVGLNPESRPQTQAAFASLALTRGTSETAERWSFATQNTRITQKVSTWDRQDILAKAREEYLENPDASGIVSGLAREAMGFLPAYQFRSNDNVLNTEFERVFFKYARQTRLERTCLQAAISLIVDGEAFIQFAYDPTIPHLPVRPVCVDSQRVIQPSGVVENRLFSEGIEYNQYGSPIAYHIAVDPERPNESWRASETVRLSAEAVAHLFMPILPEQRRGFSWLIQGLETLGRVSDYEDAVLENVKNLGALNGVFTTDYGWPELRSITGQPAEPYYPGSNVPWSRGGVLFLPPKGNFSSVSPSHPVSNHDTYVKHEVARVGNGMGVPRYMALGSSADYNFASGKLDHARVEPLIHSIRNIFELDVLDWISKRLYLSVFPDLERKYPNAPSPGTEIADYFWRPAPEINIQAEAAAEDMRIKNGTLTRKQIIERRGGSYDETIRGLNREMKDFGPFEHMGEMFGSPVPEEGGGGGSPIQSPQNNPIQNESPSGGTQ